MYTAIRRRQRWIHLKLQVCNSMWYEDPDWTGTCTEMKKRMKGMHVWTLILGIHEGHSNSDFRDPLQVFSQVPKRRLPWTSTALKFVFKQPKVQIHEVSSLCSSRTRERFYIETIVASIGLTTKVVHHELICQYPKLALWRCYENPGMLFSHTVVLDITLSLYYQRDCIYLGCICIEAISNLSELRSILTEVLIMRLTSVLT